jgi:hypothetical protein
MAVVRLEAMRGLRAAIECAIPDLHDHICVGQAPPDHLKKWPNLAIDPGRWRYEPDQEMEHHEFGADRVVFNVGRHDAAVVLRLGAQMIGQRAELEQRLIDLFLADEHRPGILLTPITSCAELGEFVAAWALDEDEWQDDDAIERHHFSVVTLSATIPALVTRCGIYRINDLRLGLADFGVTADPATFGTVAEVVRINEDGTITPL